MILVDTSIWIDHLHRGDPQLATELHNSRVLIHPFVVGEIACGKLRKRTETLQLLHNIPHATVATDAEVLFFIEHHALMGRGIGYVDAHLLAAASLSPNTRLWTRDQRLQRAAASLHLAARTLN